jgi:hypothetical protein
VASAGSLEKGSLDIAVVNGQEMFKAQVWLKSAFLLLTPLHRASTFRFGAMTSIYLLNKGQFQY